MEKEPDRSQSWEARADYTERQLNVRPEEDWSGVVDDIVGMLEVFASDGISRYNSGDAYSTGTALLVTTRNWRARMFYLRCTQSQHCDDSQLLFRLHSDTQDHRDRQDENDHIGNDIGILC